MTYEEAIILSNTLIAREREAAGSVPDEEIEECLSALRTARSSAPGAKKSRTKAEPVDLGAVFGGPFGSIDAR